MNHVMVLLKLMRAHQFIKNLFIFLPLFFAGGINHWPPLSSSLWSFFAFCCATAAVYIFNDMQDIEDDKRHPEKKHRPLAAGKINLNQAIFLMLILFVVALVLMFMVSKKALLVMLLYVCINVAYSLFLKRLAVIDVCVIAIGFVLRLVIGSAASDVPLSMWIVLMTFLLALFLALAKRRDDVVFYEMTGTKLRAAVKGYDVKKLDIALVVIAMVTVVAYVMYTLSHEIMVRLHTDYLYMSAIFVLFGVLRYLFLVIVRHKGHSPIAVMFSDRPLQLAIILWLAFFSWVIYK